MRKVKPREVKGSAEGHKAQSWDFNQGSNALNYQALGHTNSLKTSLTKIQESWAKFPSLQVKQTISNTPHAECGSNESHAISGYHVLEFRI